jgi:diguanylate cyclase (GGDEF)-like protein
VSHLRVCPSPDGTADGSERGYAFTDPLGETPEGSRRRIRHAHVLIYGSAAPSLLLAMLADGGPLAQRLATGTAALATALMALVMLLWRRAPDGLLIAGFPLAALTVTSVAILDPPLALTPMYYVWPLMAAAYFLQRREVALTYATVCGSFAAVAPWAVDQGPPLVHCATVAIVGGVVVLFVDALKRRLDELVGRLRHIARVDDLTGALSRRAFLEHVDASIAVSRRGGGDACSLAVIDIDHFKTINDRFGHAAGDAALRRLAAVVDDRLPAGALLGRLGGEEFAVLLPGMGRERAEACAEDLRTLVARDAAMAGAAFTVSVGVACLADGHRSGEDLLADADVALYRAKHAGRDTVRVAA